ncbi:MAG: hypothetical protein GEU90_21590 [Gemmatimonas sp.]|nr:hypothetical protein [Gemmatimonas sp.]
MHRVPLQWEENEGPGGIEIEAPVEGFEAGETYEILLTLRRPGMALSGFQVTARSDDGGSQAGGLHASPAEDGRVTVSTDQGIEYGYQVGSGSQPSSDGVSQWTLLWTAPADASANVVFNAAANAADGDDTAEGDEIYTASVTVAPAQH